MKNNFCTLLLALIIPIFIFGQDNGKITGNIFDIKVLDHLIITENAYFSFADENLL